MSKLAVIRGKVWKFGNNVGTVDIMPTHGFYGASFKDRDIVFAGMRPDWKNQVKPGDCIIAGDNFGCGSHLTNANSVMKELGIGCIIADSIARLYLRTAIGIGYPAFACPGVSQIFNEGDELELDTRKVLIKNLTTGKSIQGKPYPPQLLNVLESGGIMPLLVRKVHEDSRA